MFYQRNLISSTNIVSERSLFFSICLLHWSSISWCNCAVQIGHVNNEFFIIDDDEEEAERGGGTKRKIPEWNWFDVDIQCLVHEYYALLFC